MMPLCVVDTYNTENTLLFYATFIMYGNLISGRNLNCDNWIKRVRLEFLMHVTEPAYRRFFFYQESANEIEK
jgi:hypothetical protein